MEEYEILDALVDERGEPLNRGDSWVSSIVADPDYRVLLIVAGPGSGKSILASNLKRRLRVGFRGKIWPLFCSIDDFIAEQSIVYGPNRKYWPDEARQVLSDNMANTAKAFLERSATSPPLAQRLYGKLFQIWDTIALTEDNWGRTIVEVLAGDPRVKALGLVPHPKNLEEAYRQRVALEPFIKSQTDQGYHLGLVDIFEHSGVGLDMVDERVLRFFLPKIGNAVEIPYVQKHIIREAELLQQRGEIDISQVGLPDDTGDLEESVVREFKLRVGHMRHFLQRMGYGNRGIVAVVKHLPLIHLYIEELLSEEDRQRIRSNP